MANAETLEFYDLNENYLGVKNREDFYKEIKKEFKISGKITKQIKTIRLLLLTSDGKIYLQKRSKTKAENPGLYDKTIGGHTPAGHSTDITLIKECSEELGFAAAIVSSEEFKTTLHSIDLSIIALVKKIDYISCFESKRIAKDGFEFTQPQMSTFYMGYYDGAIRFKDGESSGIEVFSLNELEKELKTKPARYTEDLKFIVNKYKKYLVALK